LAGVLSGFMAIAKGAGIVAGIASAVTVLAGAITVLSGSLTRGLVGALGSAYTAAAQLTGALTVMPALLVSIGAAAAAIKIGFAGIGDAIKAGAEAQDSNPQDAVDRQKSIADS